MTARPGAKPIVAAAERDASKAVVQDGAALGGSAMLTALAGLIGWLIAARLLPQAEIGRSAAFVNSFLLVASVSELGIGPAMLRWLPRAGTRAFTLLLRCYGAALGAALVLSLIWGLLFRVSLGAALGEWPLGVVLLAFVLASVSWVTFHLEDEALTGLGWARFVPIENGIFAVVRIALLILLAPRLGGLGIVLSWLIPTLVLVLVVNTLIASAVARREARDGWLPSRAEVWRLTAPTYPAQVAVAITASVCQVLVNARLGAETGAVFFVVWTGMNSLDLALTGFGNSLVVQLAKGGEDTGGLVRSTFIRVFAIELPVLLIAGCIAPWLLALFGPGYVAGTVMMRWVLLGFLARTVVIIVCSLHLAAGRSGRLAALQGITAAATLVLSLSAPGLSFFGVGYVLIQLLVAAVALADVLLLRRPVVGDSHG